MWASGNFIKKETLAQVFSCEFCEIFKNTFFAEHLWMTASVPNIKIFKNLGFLTGVTIVPSFFLLDNNESFAFIGIKWNFFDVFPLTLKNRKSSKKKQVSSNFENNENRGGIYLHNWTINQLFQTQVFIQIFGKSL